MTIKDKIFDLILQKQIFVPSVLFLIGKILIILLVFTIVLFFLVFFVIDNLMRL